MAEQKQLERIPAEGMVAGVAAGFADYFDIEITLMRLIFVIAALATSGGAIVAYIALAIFMPVRGATKEKAGKEGDVSENINRLTEEIRDSGRGTNIVNMFGIGLTAVGFWLLLGQLFPGWWFVRWEFIWPILLIALGVIILARSRK